MLAGNSLNFNGKIFRSDKLLISPDNRSFRYGDGCFETIKIFKGKILLENHHFERLFTSLETLQFELPGFFTPTFLQKQILALAKLNSHEKLARVRLTLFRGNGGLYDLENYSPNYCIQTWPLNPANNQLNENGLVVDVFTDARKVNDLFSPIKSNNYLSYAMAAMWAKRNKLNDAILLNPFGDVADATIANVFIVKDGDVQTPSLNEGPVNGNMRRYLLQSLRKQNIQVEEKKISVEDLQQASEIFLTNAIYGIRWVKQLGRHNYQNQLAALLHRDFIKPMFE